MTISMRRPYAQEFSPIYLPYIIIIFMYQLTSHCYFKHTSEPDIVLLITGLIIITTDNAMTVLTGRT